MLREYLAFISYRHADNKEQGRQWATWLHQFLETYEVPADLIGKTNNRGEVIPARIFPIFRDEEELPAHADLANSITHALEQSRLLIVLCSPNAVASTYVAEEIRYFKKLGHSDRIIAAMINGEPNASWDLSKQAAGISPEAECFPLPLQFIVDESGELTTKRAEPIAADFRVNINGESQQGWCNLEAFNQHLITLGYDSIAITKLVANYREQQKLMLLKIVAGILGVPLGELTQRDKAYQLELERKKAKRLAQWLSGALLLALLALSAGVIAWTQKQLAIQNKTLAEQQTELAKQNEATALIELARNHAYSGNPVAAGISLLGALTKQDTNEKHGESLPQSMRTLISDIVPKIGSEKQIPSPGPGEIRVEDVSLSNVGRVAGRYRRTDTQNHDEFAVVWDLATGAELIRLELDTPFTELYRIVLSPNGQFLAVWPTSGVGDEVLIIHEVDTGKQYELDLARKPISEVSFSSNLIIIGSFDGAVEAFDITSLASVWLHETISNDKLAVDEIIASDLHSAVLINSGEALFIHDLDSGAIRASVSIVSARLEGATFDPELPRVYVFDRNGIDNRVIALELTSMNVDAIYSAGNDGILGRPWGALLPGTKILAYISGNGQLSWSSVEDESLHSTRALIASERLGLGNVFVRDFEFHSVSPDLKQIAFTIRNTGVLSIFELAPQFWPDTKLNVSAPRAELLLESMFTHGPAGGIMSSDWAKFFPAHANRQDDQIGWMVFSQRSQKGGRFFEAFETIFRWDIKEAQFLPVAQTGSDKIVAIATKIDESMFVTGSSEGKVLLWDTVTGKAITSWSLPESVIAISVLPDDASALVLAGNNLYRLNFATQTIAKIETPPITNIRAAIYRNNQRFVVTSKSGLWSGLLEEPTRLTFIREERIEAATFLGDSDVLAISSDNGIYLYDMTDSVRIATLTVDTDSYFSSPNFMSFDPFSNTLIVLSETGLITFDVSAYLNISWRSAMCKGLGDNLSYPEAQRLGSDRVCHQQTETIHREQHQ